MSDISNVAKGKDLPLHKSNINLCLSPFFPEEDLELWGSSKTMDTLETRGTSFDSFLEIFFALSSLSRRGWGTFLMIIFNLSMLEGRLNRVGPNALIDGLQIVAGGVEEATVVPKRN